MSLHASLFNLIVAFPENERAHYVMQITQKVMERFPCRVFFIKITPEGPLSSLLSPSGMDISVPPPHLAEVPFLILPHFLPDLPIYLLWAQDPTLHPNLLSSLQKWATRTIYDSETAQNLPSFCSSLLATSKDVSDLNWARTESWRELLAATFYSEDRLSSLKKATSFSLHYNAITTPFFCHTQIQSLYLTAWLSSRMQISPTLTFTPQTLDTLPPGAIISLDIATPDQTHFSFHRDHAHPEEVRALICDEEKCDIPSCFIFSKTQARLSLVNQIYHSTPQSHFLDVLRHLEDKR